jgi:cell division protein FtsI (penicillin-binding protein 3)
MPPQRRPARPRPRPRPARGRRPSPRPPARRTPARKAPATRRTAAGDAQLLQAWLATTLAGLGPALQRARAGRRLSLLLIAYLVLTLFMGWRLVSVQVVDAAEYRSLAQRQTMRDMELPALRGKLYDRAGQPLAMSLVSATVYANPRQLREGDVAPAAVAGQLAPLLDRPAGELAELLGRDSTFVYLGRQLPRQVGEQIMELRLPGVGVLEEPKRTYPSDGLAAQVVGFAGIDHTGLSGLEAHFDDVLAGEPGRVRLERAPGGLTISAAPREVEPPVPGGDLVLTLDRQIQHVTEQALLEAVEEFDAKGGSAVVLDVESGEILAMASVPGYSSATVGSADPYARRNRSVTDVFEPGSVNKVITTAAALEEGLVTPSRTFTVADHMVLAGKRFKDAHPHETKPMTVADIMVESSNVGTIQIAQELGEQGLYDYLRKFGYGSLTGVGFPGESAGLLWPTDSWSGTSLPTIAIGQGVSATLLQVANVYGVIANDGRWTAPSLVRGTVAEDGRLRPVAPPDQRRVVSETTAAQVREMLGQVVYNDAGTGKLAAVPGYTVAGKTGTAQKPSETSRGYEPGAYIGSFAGYAPAERPALVAAVIIDEPTPIYGGLTAAPVFREIMQFALAHQRIEPTHEVEVEVTPEEAADTAVREGTGSASVDDVP